MALSPAALIRRLKKDSVTKGFIDEELLHKTFSSSEVPEGAVVHVQWIDSCGSLEAWVDGFLAASIKPCVCRSAGVVLHHDEHCITLALNVNDNGDVDGVISIPQVAVQALEVLWCPAPKI